MNGISDTGHVIEKEEARQINDLNIDMAIWYGKIEHADHGRFKRTLGWNEINQHALHDPSIKPIVVITTGSYPYKCITAYYI